MKIAIVAAVLMIIAALVYAWRRRQRQSRIISFVALLGEPREITREDLIHAANRAWKVDLGHEDLERPDGFVVGTDHFSTIVCKGEMFLVNNFEQPYFNEVEKLAAELPDPRIARLCMDHQAWFSVDAMGIDRRTPEEDIKKAYRKLGRLMANLIDDDVLMLFVPDLGAAYPINDETVLALRSKNPIERLQETGTVPIVNIADDDPRMRKAVEEARERWPEFVAAFEQQTGENLAVKAPITAGGNTEFIWITVTAIEGDRIYGELANDPAALGHLKLGSKVSVSLSDLNDWVYMDGETMRGGFTVAVLTDAAKGKKRRKKS